jgi:hypothetical protein
MTDFDLLIQRWHMMGAYSGDENDHMLLKHECPDI